MRVVLLDPAAEEMTLREHWHAAYARTRLMHYLAANNTEQISVDFRLHCRTTREVGQMRLNSNASLRGGQHLFDSARLFAIASKVRLGVWPCDLPPTRSANRHSDGSGWHFLTQPL